MTTKFLYTITKIMHKAYVPLHVYLVMNMLIYVLSCLIHQTSLLFSKFGTLGNSIKTRPFLSLSNFFSDLLGQTRSFVGWAIIPFSRLRKLIRPNVRGNKVTTAQNHFYGRHCKHSGLKVAYCIRNVLCTPTHSPSTLFQRPFFFFYVLSKG